MTHIHDDHPGRWPRSDRHGLTRVHPWPDASSYDLSELTIEELVHLWTDLGADALRAQAAGLTGPPARRGN